MTDLITELKALKEKATPGTLTAVDGVIEKDSREPICCGRGTVNGCCGEPDIGGEYFKVADTSPENAALFVALVNHLPTILAKLEEGERMREALQRIAGHPNANALILTGKPMIGVGTLAKDALEPTHDH